MKVRVPDDSALPMNLVKLLEECRLSDTLFCFTIETVIERLTHYFSYVELRCIAKNGNKLKIIADTDVNNLADQDGNIIPLDALVKDICKSIKVVDLYGAEIFKVKF